MTAIFQKHVLAAAFVFTSVFTVSVASPLTALAEEIAVVVSATNPIGELSLIQIRGYYLRDQAAWPNGKKVRPVDRTDESPEKKAFLGKVMKLTSNDLEHRFTAKHYESGLSLPAKVRTDAEVLEYVATFDGAVGYVNAKSITGDNASKVKVIARIEL